MDYTNTIFEELVERKVVILNPDKTWFVFFDNSAMKKLGYNLNELVIPSYIKTIDTDAFVKCEVEKIIISEECEFISTDAFIESRIKEIEIPKTVRYIGPGAFEDCLDLKRVYIDKNEQLVFLDDNEDYVKAILTIKGEETIDELLDMGKTLKEINNTIQERER